jgi:hypothetical protein
MLSTDRAAAALLHRRDAESTAEVGALQGDVDRLLPDVLGEERRGAVGLPFDVAVEGEPPEAGVVVEHVEATELALRGPHRGLDVVGLAHVGGHRDGLAARGHDLLGAGRRRIGREVGADDFRSDLGEQRRARASHAGSGTGDQRGLAFQIHQTTSR